MKLRHVKQVIDISIDHDDYRERDIAKLNQYLNDGWFILTTYKAGYWDGQVEDQYAHFVLGTDQAK